jgi:hypothetical protein
MITLSIVSGEQLWAPESRAYSEAALSPDDAEGCKVYPCCEDALNERDRKISI